VPNEAELESFIALVESNAHDAAIERYYAEDATMQENFDPPRKGRDTLVANERAFLQRWSKVRSQCIRPVFRDGDHVVIRWVFEFTGPRGNTRKIDEIAYQRWQDDKIVWERFYYDPKQMQG
jgi:hypothetical protein